MKNSLIIGFGRRVKGMLIPALQLVNDGETFIYSRTIEKVIADKKFEPIELPVSKAHLTQEGLSETFIKYMQRWQGFVEE